MDQRIEPLGDNGIKSLSVRAFHALKWRSAGTVLQVALQFAVGIALMRLLSPEAFGVVGMALVIIGFVKLIGDMGFNVSIVQRLNLTRDHIQVAFTCCMSIGILLFTGVWFFAPMVARLFVHEELTAVLRAMAIAFVFSAISATPIAVLRRELKFRTLAVIETISYFVGYGFAGITLAISGFGVWSLVAANVLQPLCLASLALIVTRQSIKPFFRRREFLDLFPLASAEVLNNLTNYLADNLHFFVVGKWLGAYALGLYSRSFYLMSSPVNNFAAMVFSVMFPLFSQIQGDVSRLARAFLQIFSLASLVTIPIFFALAAVPEIVIDALFGQQWKGAAGVFQILCFSGPFMALMQIFGAVHYARGYVFKECGRQAVYLLVMVIGVGALMSRGIEGIAFAVAMATFARYLFLAQLSLTLLEISWRQFFVVHIPGFLLGSITFSSAYVGSIVGHIFEMPDSLQLLMIMSICALCLTITFLLLPSSWFGDLYPWLFERFGMHFPHSVRKRMVAKISAYQS